MTRSDIETALRGIFSDLFGGAAGDYGPDSSPDSVPDWDSTGHLNLVAAVEECFEVEPSPDDQVDMLSFDLIVDIVERLRAAA